MSVAIRSVCPVRTTTTVATSRHLTVRVVHCADDHAHWSEPEVASGTEVVLVQRGRFRLHADGRGATVDPTSGYLQVPGRVARYAHPAGGDVCTSITLHDDALTHGVETATSPTVRVDGRLELAHRALFRSHADPHFAAAEAVAELLQLALRHQPDERPAPGRHRLAERAREAILADDPESTSLVDLARLLDAAPSHLSRTFRHHVGLSVSRYRNRVRVSRALERLADGEIDLAGLAVGLGFSDQAHLTRVIRQEVGLTPRRVRDLLAPGSGAAR